MTRLALIAEVVAVGVLVCAPSCVATPPTHRVEARVDALLDVVEREHPETANAVREGDAVGASYEGP